MSRLKFVYNCGTIVVVFWWGCVFENTPQWDIFCNSKTRRRNTNMKLKILCFTIFGHLLCTSSVEMGPLAGERRFMPNWTIAYRLCVCVFGVLIDRRSSDEILCQPFFFSWKQLLSTSTDCEKYFGCVLLNLWYPDIKPAEVFCLQ